jgi:hypothetical protein
MTAGTSLSPVLKRCIETSDLTFATRLGGKTVTIIGNWVW